MNTCWKQLQEIYKISLYQSPSIILIDNLDALFTSEMDIDVSSFILCILAVTAFFEICCS